MQQYNSRSKRNLFSIYSLDDNSRTLKVENLKDATIYPLSKGDGSSPLVGGVLCNRGLPCDISRTKRYQPNYRERKDYLVDWYDVDRITIADAAVNNSKAIFLGVLSSHFGHFILETLSRIWFLIENPQLDLSEYQFCFLADGYNHSWNDIFTIFGIPLENIVIVERPTRFSEVIVPEQSFVLNSSAHFAYFKIFDVLNSMFSSEEPTKKIFLTKSRSLSKRGFGDAILARCFSANGFDIIAPEELDILDFIKLMSQCHTLVASSGTNAHNSVFLNKRSKLVCLNRSQHMHPSQLLIDQGKDLDTVYIDCHFFDLPHTFGNLPCCYGITSDLKNYFKDHEMLVPEIRKTDEYKMILFYIPTYIRSYLKFKIKSLYKYIKNLKAFWS